MSVKFNSLGQWTLIDGSGTQLIKGIKPAGQEVSSRFEKTDGKTGADVAKTALATGALPELNKSQRQPTNEELFGHLVVSEEQVKKAEENWNNTFNNHFDLLKKPIENQRSKENLEWGKGKSFNSTLTEEERRARASYVGKEDE
jgi:hypothetical protein